MSMALKEKTYVVEHLDEELGPWSELEYLAIAKESHEHGANFCLSSVAPSLELPATLKNVQGFTADPRSVEVLFAESKTRVCLLDPAATKELAPTDGQDFDVFLFGGILGEFKFLLLHFCDNRESSLMELTLDRR
jgi:ribosome biogenesis SPOUT family RNA methylase Rps3